MDRIIKRRSLFEKSNRAHGCVLWKESSNQNRKSPDVEVHVWNENWNEIYSFRGADPTPAIWDKINARLAEIAEWAGVMEVLP